MPINFDQLNRDLAPVLLIILAVIFIWLTRRILLLLLGRPLAKLLERTGRTDVDEIIKTIVVPPVRILLIALSIYLASRLLTLDPSASVFVQQLTQMLVIIAVTLIIYRLVSMVFLTRGRLYSITGIAVEDALLPFVRTGLQIVIVAMAVILVLRAWGFDVSGLIAGLGIGGLAISLAAQDTLSNLFGFTAIVGDRPFVVGEYIKTKDLEGTIEKVGLRSTRVRQIDQAVVTVPNSVLASSAILNWSRLQKRQINLTLGITYGVHSAELQELLKRLRDVLAKRETVDPNSVVVNLVNFGERSLEILVRCYLNIAEWGPFTQEKENIFLEIMATVEEMGLQVAVPSRTLYIENLHELLGRSSADEQHAAQPNGHEGESDVR
jgi:MscS family membrane protein